MHFFRKDWIDKSSSFYIHGYGPRAWDRCRVSCGEARGDWIQQNSYNSGTSKYPLVWCGAPTSWKTGQTYRYNFGTYLKTKCSEFDNAEIKLCSLWVSMPWAQTTDSFSLKSSSDFLMLYTILKHFISWFWIKMWAHQFYKQWYELMVKRVLRRKRHL